jgi:hypothetical protein
MKRRSKLIALAIVGAVLCGVVWLRPGMGIGLAQRAKGRHSVADRLAQFGIAARRRVQPAFAAAKAPYPPQKAWLVAFKSERALELYAPSEDQSLRRICRWPILGASGEPGPKLREGDHQVPAGIYRIESLNPKSLFHVSLRLNYPNAFDRQMAASDGRADLGGDIMIHGSSASIGCLAMGDPAAEELFTMVADSGVDRFQVLISPVDFRAQPNWSPRSSSPTWVPQLYAAIRQQLTALPLPSSTP